MSFFFSFKYIIINYKKNTFLLNNCYVFVVVFFLILNYYFSFFFLWNGNFLMRASKSAFGHRLICRCKYEAMPHARSYYKRTFMTTWIEQCQHLNMSQYVIYHIYSIYLTTSPQHKCLNYYLS